MEVPRILTLFSFSTVSVHLDCYNKVSQTRRAYKQEAFISLWSGDWEDQGQGTSMVMF